MEKLNIKEIKLKPFANIGTLKDFNNGLSEFGNELIIKTNIPKNYNPMISQRHVKFFIDGLKGYEVIKQGNQEGYHVVDDYIILNFGEVKETIDKLKHIFIYAIET